MMGLIYPLIAQILLTLVVLIRLAAARYRLLKAGELRLSQMALSKADWPDHVTKLSNNYENQFETPVLFYALIFAALHTGATGMLMQILAWGFVLSRLLHCLIHTGDNNVVRRFRTFVGGVVVLFVMAFGVLLAAAH